MAGRGGKGTQISFGKVSVYSEEEGLSDVYATFSKVLINYGYPEEEIEYELSQEDDEEDEHEQTEHSDEAPWSPK